VVFRFCSKSVSPYTGEPYGIFVAVWHLIRDKRVTSQEEADYWENRAWFEANLPIPPYYAEGNPQRAITWFKQSTTIQPLLEHLSFYQNLAASYGLQIVLESTDSPGTIIYQDEFQIASTRQPAATI
jgi:hypothetical protein